MDLRSSPEEASDQYPRNDHASFFSVTLLSLIPPLVDLPGSYTSGLKFSFETIFNWSKTLFGPALLSKRSSKFLLKLELMAAFRSVVVKGSAPREKIFKSNLWPEGPMPPSLTL